MTPRMIDIFAGIGCCTSAFRRAGYSCVFASEIDLRAADTFQANHGLRPAGDVAGIDPDAIPDHEVCVAGLPCQSFSEAGGRRGFEDPRSHVLHGLLRVLAAKRSPVVLVENAARLAVHDGGRTLRFLCGCLRALGYVVAWRILRAADFGGAQPRPRVFFVGSRGRPFDFGRLHMRRPARILDVMDPDVPNGWLDPSEYTLLDRPVRCRGGLLFVGHRNRPPQVPGGNPGRVRTHWHANRIYSALGLSPTLLASGPGNRFWVEAGGRVRRLTRPERVRLMGLPDGFLFPHPGHFRTQLGNGVFVPCVEELATQIKEQLLSEEVR